jgi:SNF2 family DNA or RNA helicase
MPTPLKLFDYQEAGVEWLKRERYRLLAWEPGVGKTPPAVVACEELNAYRVLVLCPPIATGVWVSHFRNWAPSYSVVRVFHARETPNAYNWAKGAGVRIVPYSQISRLNPVIDALKGLRWDALILDETHALKTIGSVRTRQVLGEKCDLYKCIASAAARVWCLTGTPLLNHAAEFWPMLHALAPETIAVQNQKPLSYEQFVDRFCVTRPTLYGVRIVGSKNADELSRRVQPFMSRKRKRDAGLPPLLFSEYVLPREAYLSPGAKDQLAQLTGGLDTLDDDEFLAALGSGKVHLATVRRILGEAKVAPVVELVDDMLETDPDQKVIVFAHHTRVIEELRRRLNKHGAIVIDGGTSNVPGASGYSARDLLVEKFQSSPLAHVAILQIQAAGTAATLTASSTVLFCEASWVPNENAQAASRAHRVGQTNPVTAQFITLPGTLDERIQRVLAQKAREIGLILDPV